MRGLAVAGVLAMAAISCGDGSEATPSEPTATTAEVVASSEVTASATTQITSPDTADTPTSTTTGTGASTTTKPQFEESGGVVDAPAFDIQSAFECVMGTLGPDVAWGLGGMLLPSQMLAKVEDCPIPTHDQNCVLQVVGQPMLDKLVMGSYQPSAEDVAMVAYCKIATGTTWAKWLNAEDWGGDNDRDYQDGDDNQADDQDRDDNRDYRNEDDNQADDQGRQPCPKDDMGNALGPECNVPVPPLPEGVYRAELVEISTNPAAHSPADSADCEVFEDGQCAEIRWQSVAPMLAGDFTSIQIAPTNPNIMYAGIDSNDMSLFKTTDGGASWQMVHVTGHTSGVAISPADPDVVIYSVLEVPVQRSTDGGRSWSAVLSGNSPGDEFNPFTAVAFSPTAPQIAYTSNVLGSSRGGRWPPPPAEIYRSGDAGATWLMTGVCDTCGAIQTIAVEPDNPDVLWVAADGGVQVSQDRGATWSGDLLHWVDWRAGQPDSNGGHYAVGLAIRPDRPQVVLAATAEQGLFRSTNGGTTWSESNSGLGTRLLHRLAFAANDPNVVYLSTHEGMYRSDDAGQTWTHRSDGLPYLFVNAIAVHPTDPDTAYVGTAAEVMTAHPQHFNPGRHEGQNLYRTTDGGRTWHAFGDGIVEAKVTQLSTHPLIPFVLWAGGESGRGGFSTMDAGTKWAVSPSHAGHYPMVYAFSHGLPTEMYLTSWSTHSELVTSTDGGASWFHLTANIAAGVGDGSEQQGLWEETKPEYHLHGLAVAPSDPNVIYVGSVHDTTTPANFTLLGIHIFRSNDRGATFVEKGNGFPIQSHSAVNAIVVHPQNPDIVYVMTSLFESTDAFGIFKSDDGGESWTHASDGLDLVTNDLQIDPVDPDTLYAATGTGVYKTIDAAETWTRMSDGIPDVPVVDLAIDPINPLNLYAITPDNHYRSKDGGAHWYSASLGIELLASLDRSASLLPSGRRGHFTYGGTFGHDRTLEIDATGRVLYVAAKTQAADDWRAIRHVYRAVLGPLRVVQYAYRVPAATIDVESTSNIHDMIYDENARELRFTASGPPGTTGSTTLTIPPSLFHGPFRVLVDGQPVGVVAYGQVVSFDHNHEASSELVVRSASSE